MCVSSFFCDPNTISGKAELWRLLLVLLITVLAVVVLLISLVRPRNRDEFFSNLESLLTRLAVFVIFLVGLGKVLIDTLDKILK
jgi:hypothetical protein